MRVVAAVLLIAATLELAGASVWVRVLDTSDTCRIDDDIICVDSLGWLER
jgi:hypothetical protein